MQEPTPAVEDTQTYGYGESIDDSVDPNFVEEVCQKLAELDTLIQQDVPSPAIDEPGYKVVDKVVDGTPIEIESDDDEDDWSIEDIVDFTKQFSTLQEMKDNRPTNITPLLWKAILDIYDLCCEYGPNPQHILGHLEARANGTIYEPNGDAVVKNPNHELARADALTVMRDCGFDDDRSLKALELSGNDVAKAIELATTWNLSDRAAEGEFGDPTLAVPFVNADLDGVETKPVKGMATTPDAMDKLNSCSESQVDPETHGGLIQHTKTVMNADNMTTLPYELPEVSPGGVPENVEEKGDVAKTVEENTDWRKCLGGVEARTGHMYT